MTARNMATLFAELANESKTPEEAKEHHERAGKLLAIAEKYKNKEDLSPLYNARAMYQALHNAEAEKDIVEWDDLNEIDAEIAFIDEQIKLHEVKYVPSV